MKRILNRHKSLWTKKSFLFGVSAGIFLVVAGLGATYYANFYTTMHASNPVTDIILDNLPVVNVDFIFNEGALIFLSILTALLIHEPRRIPFVLKSVGFFLAVRSAFMVLTHLAPPPHQSYIDTADILHKLSSGDDLFFSGHTGLPFMLFFVFWNDKLLRYMFLAFTFVGGASMLLGHLHYSIDIFSALFISFGVFYAAKNIFRKDYLLFLGGNAV